MILSEKLICSPSEPFLVIRVCQKCQQTVIFVTKSDLQPKKLVVSLDNLDVVYLGHIDTSHGDIMIGERPSTYEHDDISLPFRFILFSQTCVCLSVWISEKWTFELCILI